MKLPKANFSFIVGEPRFEKFPPAPEINILTHLQKYSPFGFLVTWPFCFHFWWFWQKQLVHYFTTEKGIDEIWSPGTERGIYFRTPGWRWDADLGMIWTWGYVGGHWD